jgi:hypothetical protein
MRNVGLTIPSAADKPDTWKLHYLHNSSREAPTTRHHEKTLADRSHNESSVLYLLWFLCLTVHS